MLRAEGKERERLNRRHACGPVTSGPPIECDLSFLSLMFLYVRSVPVRLAGGGDGERSNIIGDAQTGEFNKKASTKRQISKWYTKMSLAPLRAAQRASRPVQWPLVVVLYRPHISLYSFFRQHITHEYITKRCKKEKKKCDERPGGDRQKREKHVTSFSFSSRLCSYSSDFLSKRFFLGTTYCG